MDSFWLPVADLAKNGLFGGVWLDVLAVRAKPISITVDRAVTAL
jgi:hypothetical protein